MMLEGAATHTAPVLTSRRPRMLRSSPGLASQTARVGKQVRALRRKGQQGPAAVKEAHAPLVLEARHHAACRRLGEPQLARGAGEAAQPRRGDKGLDLLDARVHPTPP